MRVAASRLQWNLAQRRHFSGKGASIKSFGCQAGLGIFNGSPSSCRFCASLTQDLRKRIDRRLKTPAATFIALSRSGSSKTPLRVVRPRNMRSVSPGIIAFVRKVMATCSSRMFFLNFFLINSKTRVNYAVLALICVEC